MSPTNLSALTLSPHRIIAFAIAFAALLSQSITVSPVYCQSKPAAKPAPGKPPQTVNNSAIYNAYIARLRGKIANSWFLPDGNNHVVITAVVNADGSTGDVNIVSTPKDPPAEAAATEAFTKGQPFEPLPKELKGAGKLVVTFDSKVDPHGDSSSNVTFKLDPLVTAPTQGATDTPPTTQ